MKDYSTTPANNTALFPEGMAPSAVNDGMRQVQADLRSWYNDSQWVNYGDGDGAFAIAYVSPTSFSVAGADVTAVYHAGRRVRTSGSLTGTIYGTIQSAVFATNTTVTVAWDAGSLQNESLSVAIGILSAANSAMPPASVSAAGAVPLASQSEIEAGASTAKAVTPGGLAPAAMTWTGKHSFRSADAGAGEIAAIDLDRASATPAANDLLMALRWLMRDGGGGTDVAAKLVARLLDPTAGSEDAELGFFSLAGGALAERMTLGQGLKLGAPTGGDPGAGKINAVDLQVNGVSIATAPASQAEMEAASATGVFSSPGRQQHHPGHPKAWYHYDQTGTATLVADYGVSSISDDATAKHTVTFDTAFSAANYITAGTTEGQTGDYSWYHYDAGVGTFTPTAISIVTTRSDGAATDKDNVFGIFCGDL
jgi:hypothetical protein